ncbi:hypothetical protein R3I93_006716 [Phoxinus phoxinus]|uniref:Uncharacterized protein n=1 Tax=Phoxinus phoxinus TaxID=58324 RepID=A0AAN9D7C1_9TELE
MRVLKDSIFHRLKAYNITQLVDFICIRQSGGILHQATPRCCKRKDCEAEVQVQQTGANQAVQSSSSEV